MSADALPTAQVDGVVWSTVIVGNTVYAGGSFSTARPAGSAAGVNTVTRTNLLSFNLTTGALNSWAPTTNAQVLSLSASPDGSRLYIGGDFTQVNGVTHNRIAAFDTATGSLVSAFSPRTNSKVKAVFATDSTVYAGGSFSTANGTARARLAAFQASDGALTGWDPGADATVNALTATTDGAKIIAGGAFANTNDGAAYGLAALDPTSGALLSWNATNLIRNAGSQASILSLTASGTKVYGTGYVFGSGGNLEGTFSADAATGDVTWVEDCHGDTYDVAVGNDAVYTVGHAHYCGNIGGFPQTDPWGFHRGLAFTDDATGTINHDPYGYYDFFGTPSPSLYNWFPDLPSGTYTGLGQGPWDVSTNGDYVVMGGEFPSVNGTAQQGLVRFAKRSVVNNQGPRLSGSNFVPSVQSFAAGTARIAFQANWDRDDTELTYKVMRSGTTEPIYTTTASSTFWDRPGLGFTDTGLTPGATYRYRIVATDPGGNQVTGDYVSVTVASSGELSPYAQQVNADGASHYWRLGEGSGSTVGYDWAGYEDLTVGSEATRGVSGAIADDANTATHFGTDDARAYDPVAVVGPDTFSIETWFRTTSTDGGKIVSFGNSPTGSSSSYDRHIYMQPDGKVVFGVYNSGSYTVTTNSALNDGQWHQAVGTMGPQGLTLWVDGKKIGSNGGTTIAQPYTGYWRIGGDSPWSGQANFVGDIDDVSLYPSVLTKTQVQSHFVLAGGALPPGATAPSDAYGQAVYGDSPDLFYRLDETSGDAIDLSGNGNNGVYTGGYTQGVSSPVTATGQATAFDGSSGTLASSQQVSGPGVFSEELWFKTTTTNGGKLIGFGNQQGGFSGSYDRHVYMEPSGQLTFGVWTGFTNTITTPASYNDGQWHYLVATQGADGMKLYLDGALTGTNEQTSQQAYSGYWNIGGDTAWNGTRFFDGTIDEVAVYSDVLSPSQIAAHHAASPYNVAPAAAFVTSQSFLDVSVDGSASADPDGTIADYDWDWGDDTTHGATATSTHTYGHAGTYTITLTVTDDKGGTATVSHEVTMQTAPNQAPTADFTSSADGLAVQFTSTSTDADGTVETYAWNFGDGGTSTAANPTHTYGNPGDYDVTLTVTDDDGDHGTTLKSVHVTPPNVAPTASFTVDKTDLKVDVDGSGSTDSDGTIASYDWDWGDNTAHGSDATASHTYAVAGTYTIELKVTDDDGSTDTTTHTVTVSAANQAPHATFTATTDGLTATFDASESTDAEGPVASYSWDFGDGETGTGVNPSHTYATAGTKTVQLTVTDADGLESEVFTDTVTVSNANVAPTAGFTSSAVGLTANFDASTSTDTDGTIASYAWTFGDDSSGAGVSPSHDYAAAGTYTVTLTVTDNQGKTDTATSSVTVTAPAGTSFATDTFGRTLASGWGNAEVGGAWTPYVSASTMSVNGSAGLASTPAGGKSGGYLGSISRSDVDLRATVALDRLSGGNGTYVYVVGRRTANNTEYRGLLRFLSTGVVRAQITKVVSSASDTTIVGEVSVPGVTYVPGAKLNTRFQAVGTSPTTLRFKVWPDGETEPSSWTLTGTDNAAELQAAGSVGLRSYLTGSAVNGPALVSYSAFSAQPTEAAVNTPPVSSFTNNVSGLSVAFTSTATDSDGTIASYQWSFGDGDTSTQKNPSHTYAEAGTYDVTLKVTDDSGASDSKTASVTVAGPANQPPVAAFTTSTEGLAVSVNAAGSEDSDGNVTDYDWTFGDSGTGSGVTSGYTFPAAGTYPVTLTVTDDDGATTSLTKQVTVSSVVVLASDDFGRSVNNGWGTADTGGAWTLQGATSSFSVTSGKGVMNLPTAGAGRYAYLAASGEPDTDSTVDVTLSAAPDSAGVYVGLLSRRQGTDYYQARVRATSAGVTLAIQRNVGTTTTTLRSVAISGLVVGAGDTVRMRFLVVGDGGTTTLSAKVWSAAETEPNAWQNTTTDSTTSLQSAGATGLYGYLSSSSTAVPTALSFDNLRVLGVG
ncbi:MAG: PKD domain-containing protein [Nocardioidaceae bacterium]